MREIERERKRQRERDREKGGGGTSVDNGCICQFEFVCRLRSVDL